MPLADSANDAGEPSDEADPRDADRPEEPPIEPGSPSLENVAFLLLGVLVALAVVFRLVQLFG